ncbi:MAG: 6,7-dimethyl-8-ribityllumazine synthase [Labilithrix sp.]|nr:6,7-dimethyl-8-ribityllumazine synthase [Labilithrix sp.]MBX3218869.1 6,7-dimethyl-8-ribityllumazine synthase [Labilithrix sp.]
MTVSPRIVEGSLVVPKGARFGIVASRFNHFIVDHLVGGALDALVRHGADDANITVVRVPGAWEIPVAVQRLARGAGGAKKAAKLDAIIALAAVIRGSTPHFDYVAGEVSKGVASISLEASLPISFGVLTTDTIEQAVERAGTKAGNKGWDAAVSAIEMVSLDRALAGAGF